VEEMNFSSNGEAVSVSLKIKPKRNSKQSLIPPTVIFNPIDYGLLNEVSRPAVTVMRVFHEQQIRT
jgi:hypothetical protein